MDSPPDHAKRLRGLGLWGGPISVEPLPGGITNHNYIIMSGGTRFVARVCEPRGWLGIDRRNEVVCQRRPRTRWGSPRRWFTTATACSSASTSRPGRSAPATCATRRSSRGCAAALRTLHDGWDRLRGEVLYFSAFQTVGTYAATARRLGARLPDDIDRLLEDARSLAPGSAPFVPVLCHNDMLAANILDDGRRVWLVDWEYAGVGHPLFDLAGVVGQLRVHRGPRGGPPRPPTAAPRRPTRPTCEPPGLEGGLAPPRGPLVGSSRRSRRPSISITRNTPTNNFRGLPSRRNVDRDG